MASEEPQESFKITDRRHRGDDRAAAEPAPRPAPASAPAAPGTFDPERSLVGLFMMLGSSARVALGEADPNTGERGEVDLPMAAEVIDVLLVLRERTEGRRSPDEAQVLDELLYDLQLRYVDVTKRPG